MYKDISEILSKNPGLKARHIAKELSIERKVVNSFLYKNLDKFSRNSSNEWFNIESENSILELKANAWVSGKSFEESLSKAGCLLSSNADKYTIFLPKGCKPLLEAIARLLSLCNQLIYLGKEVIIDLNKCEKTKNYLNRIGFFDLLNKKVVVKPARPIQSFAKMYQGNNDAVVELGEIVPENPEDSIPKMLKNSFVAEAGDQYANAVYTFFSELFGNVCEHSQTPIPGFAALQAYTKRSNWPHIQVVVSDSGKGISGTLRPILQEHYPDLYESLDFTKPQAEVDLLEAVLLKGRITRMGNPEETARGLGLKRSAEYADQYNANISVRQETFELKINYKNGCVKPLEKNVEMPRILGTHICFDFFLNKD